MIGKPDDLWEKSQRKRWHGVIANRGLSVVELLICLGVIFLALGLFLPAVQNAREAGRRVQCKNFIHQQSVAILHFESIHQHYPSGGWGKRWAGIPDGGVGASQPGGWIYQILPQLESESLHDLGGVRPFSVPANTLRLQTPLPMLHCPSRRAASTFTNSDEWVPVLHAFSPGVARNDYAMNGGSVYIQPTGGPSSLSGIASYGWTDMSANTGLCYLRSEVRSRDITDGLSQTYLVGEKHLQWFSYFSGADWGDNESAYSGDERDLLRYTGTVGNPSMRPLWDGTPFPATHDPRGGIVFGSAHPTSFHIAMADGSIRAVTYSVDTIIHSRSGSRNDGQVIPQD